MSGKSSHRFLPIYDHFVLSKLLDTESLDPYDSPHELKPFVLTLPRSGLKAGMLSFLDPDFRYLKSGEPHLHLCGAISEALIGMNECKTTCQLRKNPPETAVPIRAKCGAGILQIQSTISVEERTVGYVRGPELPLPEFYERDLSKLDAALREDLLEYRAAFAAIRPEIVAEAVSRIARRLGRRCRLERRLKILRHTRKRIVKVNTATEALESAFLGLQALFGDVDMCLYKVVDAGHLTLVNAKGPNDLFQPTVIKAGEGHIGAALQSDEQIYAPDLSAEPIEFAQVNPFRPAQSAFTIPLQWGADQVRSALQISSKEKNRFSKPERQTIRAIADMASLAAARSELFERRRVAEIQMVGTGPWAAAMVEAIAAPADTLVQVLATKRGLYQALVDEARTICGAQTAALRVWYEVGQTMRFAAFSGTEWTDEYKKTVYRPRENSAGMHAFETGTPYHIPDVDTAEHYQKVLPNTRSLYAIPFKSRGEVAGVFSADWNHTTPEVPNREELLRLVRQFQGFLAVLDGREDAIQARLVAALRKQRTLDDLQLSIIAKEATTSTKLAFAARACSIFIQFPHENRAQLMATTGSMPTEVIKYGPGDGLTGWVLAKKKCLRIKDTSSDAELAEIDPQLRRAERFREDVEYSDTRGRMGFLAAPMIGSAGVMGVIRLTIKDDLSEFTAEEETLLLQIAREMAVTIEDGWDRAKASDELMATFGELRRLHNLLLAFATEPDLDTLIRRVLSAAIDESKMNLGLVRLLDRECLVLKAQQGPPANVLPDELELNSFLRASLTAEIPRYIQNCKTDEEWLNLIRSLPGGDLRNYIESLHSLIHIPIRLGNRPMGLVLLQSLHEVRISNRVLEFLGMLGSYAAVAIQLAAAKSDLLQTLVLLC